VTHLAPELFQVGSKLTTAVDTFSFGIMMWELYTGQRAYGGLGESCYGHVVELGQYQFGESQPVHELRRLVLQLKPVAAADMLSSFPVGIFLISNQHTLTLSDL
jgi:hypothetical protein